MADKEHEPGDSAEKVKPAKNGTKRDYSQRAHDIVREVEKRHAERHPDEDDD